MESFNRQKKEVHFYFLIRTSQVCVDFLRCLSVFSFIGVPQSGSQRRSGTPLDVYLSS